MKELQERLKKYREGLKNSLNYFTQLRLEDVKNNKDCSYSNRRVNEFQEQLNKFDYYFNEFLINEETSEENIDENLAEIERI